MAIAPQQQATAVKTNMSVKAKIISQNSDFGAPREWLNGGGNVVDTVGFEQEVLQACTQRPVFLRSLPLWVVGYVEFDGNETFDKKARVLPTGILK